MSSSVSRGGRLRFELLRYALILLAIGFALVPIVWMITMALKPVEEWTDAGAALHWWPHHPTLENFRYIFGHSSSKLITSLDTTATRPILASVLSASIGTAIAMVCGACAAYGVSRFNAGGNLPLALLQLRIFPPMAVMIPVMIMWTFLGLIDTWYGLALIYGIVTMPFAFWLMKTFFDEMPKELEEAALVEGCSRFRVFQRVTLPMMMAPFASAALLVFIFNWSDYLIALLLTLEGLAHHPGLYGEPLLQHDRPALWRESRARPHRRRAPGGARPLHSALSRARPHLWSAQAMNALAKPAEAIAPLAEAVDESPRNASRLGLWLTLPAQALLLFIVLFPLLMVLYISLTDWTPLVGKPWYSAWLYWNSFDNYTDVVTNGRFWSALERTGVIMIVCVPLELVLGLGLALLFVDEFSGKRVFYSILLMPMMVVPAVAGYMFYMLFQSGGPINGLHVDADGPQYRHPLAQPGNAGDGRGHDLRRLAVDAADVSHPAGGPARGARRSDADGGAARRGSLGALPLHRAAAYPRHSDDRRRHPGDRDLQDF